MRACMALLLCVSSAAAGARPFSEVRGAWRPSYAWLAARDGTVLQAQRIDFHGLRLPWVKLDEVSPAFVRALLAIEDQRFHAHHGVDWRALAAALWQNTTGTEKRGASTLSMQLTSLIDAADTARRGRRSVADKWQQIRAAQTLEQTWRKPEILEAYLNLVSYRGELQGLAAASAGLFNKQASGLTADESLLLATLVSTPNLDARALARRACALARAHALPHDCTHVQALAAQRLSAPPRPPIEAHAAPHLARRLLKEAGARITTTLDARLQTRVDAILAEQLRRLDTRNVRDAAAVVLDNRTGAVLAWVGAAGAASKAPAVDGVVAPRQAGSTLKPFLYGLAFEKRYLTPASLLEDSPINLETATGLYIPQNYDRDFKGVVSARTALASSLNVPAVRTLVLTGVEGFRARLFDVGYRGIREDGEYYGYSLALGSAEVSLLEQANAYRTLANGGELSAIRLKDDEPLARAHRVMDAGAAFLVGEVLADPAARALTFGLDSTLALPFWSAVKTGTSKDMRDNWCVGYSTRYTVAVWVGNFEGDAMHEVSGVSGAAPAWSAIMMALHEGVTPRAPAPPTGVVTQAIDFTPAVERPRQEWFMAGTVMRHVALAPPAARSAQIATPANGVVIALDPDIPLQRQQVTVSSRGASAAAHFFLDGTLLGAADADLAWAPVPGYHRLELRDARAVLDSVRFTVRPAR
ncbi:MAG: penicillin-binding protein 1C [Gammaproteobacteria bacterium]|nr:penicillin-binding protein 1C [Gammaproteobacteria bacterium]